MKNIFVIVAVVVLAGGAIYYFMNNQETSVVEDKGENEEVQNEERIEVELPMEIEEEEKSEFSNGEFVKCLANSGIVIYGSKTCPYCVDLVNELGGYEMVASVYVECTDESDRCSNEMQTRGVPEIQLNGDLYEGSRALDSLANLTGCEL